MNVGTPSQDAGRMDLRSVRICTLLFPPLGLILLWLNPQLPRRTKILGTCYLPAYLIVYLAAIWAIFAFGLRIDLIRWEGGYHPVLAFSRRLSNRDAKSIAGQNRARYSAAYWSGFRGPNRDGDYAEQPISTNWPSTGPPLLWRRPIGGGYSGFAIGQGRAYTIEQRREKEVATAYDLDTGRELWRHGWQARFDHVDGGEGPRSTPAYDEGRVYAQGAAGELRCLDAASGKLLWRHDIIEENQAMLPVYGFASSPLIVDNKVIVLPGGPEGRSVIAYDKRTGAPIWQSINNRQAYTSPMLVNLAARRQLLIVSARNVLGLAPENGAELWHTPWIVLNDNVIAQPVVAGSNRFLISAGYGVGCRAFEITASNSVFSVRELWRNTHLKNKFSSSVRYGEFIYGLDEEILACIDAGTGERKWKEGRFGYGQVLLASGNLLVLAENGTLALVEANPACFRQRAAFQALKGRTWNYPALANGKLLVRNCTEMACYNLTPAPQAN
jgi:outer membrane protein assembly factor BamB